jgi:hypothetical protein
MTSKVSEVVVGRLVPFWRSLLLVVLPLALLPLVFIPEDESSKAIGKCAYVGLLMAASWMLELMPLPVTALLPVALFPLMGVTSTSFVSKNYLNKTCMLFVGGNLKIETFLCSALEALCEQRDFLCCVQAHTQYSSTTTALRFGRRSQQS